MGLSPFMQIDTNMMTSAAYEALIARAAISTQVATPQAYNQNVGAFPSVDKFNYLRGLLQRTALDSISGLFLELPRCSLELHLGEAIRKQASDRVQAYGPSH